MDELIALITYTREVGHHQMCCYMRIVRWSQGTVKNATYVHCTLSNTQTRYCGQDGAVNWVARLRALEQQAREVMTRYGTTREQPTV